MPRTTLESLQSEEMLEDDNFHDFLALTTKLTVGGGVIALTPHQFIIRFFPGTLPHHGCGNCVSANQTRFLSKRQPLETWYAPLWSEPLKIIWESCITL